MPPAQPVLIRRLDTSDASAYAELRLRALRDHPEAFTSSFEEEQGKPLQVAQLRLSPGSAGKFWGAFHGDTLVGLVGLDRETRVKNRHKATVVAMHVAREAAGQGVGRALMDALVADARASGLALLVLTVTDGNASAIRLYEALGFVRFGLEPRAIQVGGQYFDKAHMALDLRPAPGH